MGIGSCWQVGASRFLIAPPLNISWIRPWHHVITLLSSSASRHHVCQTRHHVCQTHHHVCQTHHHVCQTHRHVCQTIVTFVRLTWSPHVTALVAGRARRYIGRASAPDLAPVRHCLSSFRAALAELSTRAAYRPRAPLSDTVQHTAPRERDAHASRAEPSRGERAPRHPRAAPPAASCAGM